MLGKAFIPELVGEAVDLYRESYQRFRLGKAGGAKGEVVEEGPSCRSPKSSRKESKQGEQEYDEGEEDEDFFKELGNGKQDAIYQEIFRWRLQYRMHRKGAAQGAKGEIWDVGAKKMDHKHLNMLPVMQLASEEAAKASAMEAKADGEKPSRPPGPHIHIGAGKLGLGLVVPCIENSGVRFSVLQRPSSSWALLIDGVGDDTEALQSASVTLVVGEEKKSVMSLETEKTVFAPEEGDVSSSLHNGVFVLRGDEDGRVSNMVRTAKSFSVSLGPAVNEVVAPLLLGALPVVSEDKDRPVLYACENDHDAVHKLATTLKGRVDVVSCMVDKICTSRKITADSVIVGAETYPGEIVVLAPPDYVGAPPFKAKGVMVARRKAHAEYLCQRKLVMVNGMHTTLAFTTLCRGHEPNTGLHGEAWKDLPLLTPKSAEEDDQKLFWLWAVARILYLTSQHEPQVMKAAHGITSDTDLVDILLEYAEGTLERFSSVEDKCGRVLGGGVSNRWEGRLKPVDDILKEDFGHRKLRRCLLHKAGVKEEDVRKAVSTLVEESKRFTGVYVKRQSFVSG